MIQGVGEKGIFVLKKKILEDTISDSSQDGF
jgi:hypothetical protein